MIKLSLLFIRISRSAVFQGHSDHFARKCFGATNTPPVGCVWHYICGTGSWDCIVSLLWYKCTYMNSWGTLLKVSLNFMLCLNHTREAYLKQDLSFNSKMAFCRNQTTIWSRREINHKHEKRDALGSILLLSIFYSSFLEF